MGIGAVCHTLNPRLFPEQLVYIINHAEDRIIFVDLTFVPLLDAILPHMSQGRARRHNDRRIAAYAGRPSFPSVVAYEDAIAGAVDRGRRLGRLRRTDRLWPVLHLGHDRAIPRGCCIRTAPTSCTPFMGLQATVHGRDAQVRSDPAGRADVPRQRLGHRLRRARRRDPSWSCRAPRWTVASIYELIELGRRHLLGRRAHRLAGAVRPPIEAERPSASRP